MSFAVSGVFVQDFIPGQDTSRTRRKLGGFDPDNEATSFGIAPDGASMTISHEQGHLSVMLAEHVPSVSPKLRAVSRGG